MAVFLNNTVGLKINAVDLSDHVTSVTLNYAADELEVTAMGDSAHKFVGIEKGKDTPTLTPRALKLIEKAMKDNQQKNVAEIMAILFKFESDTEVEHYSVAHLKWKTHLFRTQVTSDIALPYVVYISQKILSNIKAISVNAE